MDYGLYIQRMDYSHWLLHFFEDFNLRRRTSMNTWFNNVPIVKIYNKCFSFIEGVFYIWVSLTDRLLTFYENKDDSLN